MNTHRDPHYLTLGDAAKLTGKSKSVLSKALKNGEISFISKDESGYRIDPAELFRVFPKNTRENSSEERLRTQENSIENTIKIRELEVRLEAVYQERNFFKDQYATLEKDRDDWREQAQRLLITQQKPVETNIPILATSLPQNQQKLFGGQIFGLLAAVFFGGLIVFLSMFWRR